MTDADRCALCGEIIPEGTQYCKNCWDKACKPKEYKPRPDLLPCPFCGGVAHLETCHRAFINGQTTRVALVRCVQCYARTKRFPLADYGCTSHSGEANAAAVEAWNTRAVTQAASLLTYEGMMKAEVCFLEVKGLKEINPFIRFEVSGQSFWTSPYMNNSDDSFQQLVTRKEYLKDARCWTARPTDEQRRATPWEN